MQDKVLTDSHHTNCTDMLGNLLDQKDDHGAAILNLIERYINHFNRRYANLAFHDRQDIRQEVAIKLLCQGQKIREDCSKAWVYTVVRNQCINHVCKQPQHTSLSNANSNSEVLINETGATPSLHEGSNIRLIHQIDCLQKIFDEIESKETGKADIALYTQYAFGFSYNEMSKRSKRTVNAIAQRISLLKSRVKKLIEQYC